MIVSHLLKPETLVSIDDAKLRNVAKALEADLLKDPDAMKVITAKLSRYVDIINKARA